MEIGVKLLWKLESWYNWRNRKSSSWNKLEMRKYNQVKQGHIRSPFSLSLSSSLSLSLSIYISLVLLLSSCLSKGFITSLSIQEFIEWFKFANDEMDFGMGLEFGHDLFSANYPALDELAQKSLITAYALLGQISIIEWFRYRNFRDNFWSGLISLCPFREKKRDKTSLSIKLLASTCVIW